MNREIVTTTKGHEVEIRMTDEAAAKVLMGKTGSRFAQDLARTYINRSWSPAQRAWAHKLANEGERPAAPAASETFPGLADRLHTAGRAVNYPTVFIHGVEATLMTGGKNAGKIRVTDGGRYPNNVFHGWMDRDGELRGRGANDEAVLSALRVMNDTEALADAAGTIGRETGSCCFCGRELTHGDSLTVGYGPICAGRYGLPHGGSGF